MNRPTWPNQSKSCDVSVMSPHAFIFLNLLLLRFTKKQGQKNPLQTDSFHEVMRGYWYSICYFGPEMV